MGLLETIQSTASDVIDSQPKTVQGTVKSYHEGVCTVETSDGLMENLPCVNIPKIGTGCLVVPSDGEYTCIPNEVDDSAMIFAMGLGKFTIDNNNDLLYELPIGVTNYMSLSNGDLIVNLDNTTNQKFSIDNNGDVIYG